MGCIGNMHFHSFGHTCWNLPWARARRGHGLGALACTAAAAAAAAYSCQQSASAIWCERCERCGTEFVRDFELCSVGFKPTGRKCVHCKGALRDHCLDWDDALPEDELALSESHASKADLVLCLGTSLVITPWV